MKEDEFTAIRISKKTKEELQKQKVHPRQSFEELLKDKQILDISKADKIAFKCENCKKLLTIRKRKKGEKPELPERFNFLGSCVCGMVAMAFGKR